jgi:Holliday junction resolvasome RuvABC endonuclease subunit
MGLDQSFTSTGWYIEDTEQGLFKYGIITSNKANNNYLRSMTVAEEVCNLVHKYKVTDITLEGLPFMSKSNITRDLAGLQFVIISYLLQIGFTVGLDITIIPPSQLKKFATGSGKATKQEMFEALPAEICNSVGKTPKTQGRYDITDAYWLSQFNKE